MSTEAEIVFEQGNSFMQDGMDAEAISAFKKAISLNPKVSKYHAYYAFLLIRADQYDKAMKEADLAITLDPNSILGFRQRGRIYFHLENYESAIQDYTRAIEIEPNNPSSYSLRFDAYYESKDFENYFLDLVRWHELEGQVYPYSEEDDPKEFAHFLKTIDKHFSEVLFPKLKEKKEKIVRYYPLSLIFWGGKEKQVFVNGTSYIQKHGTHGQGYICITDKNLHIFSSGELSRILEKSVETPLLFSFLNKVLPSGDKTEVSKKDEYWSTSNLNITSIQVSTDLDTKKQFIRIVTPVMHWDIHLFYSGWDEIVSIALNMAKTGKFNDVWGENLSKETSSHQKQAEVLGLIKQLSEFKAQGIISEPEFQNKKKELLSRL